MHYLDIQNVILMVLIPFVFVVLIIPLIKKIAFHIGALDIPNERKIHTKPMPRLGGLGIYAGFLLGYILFGEYTYMMNSILIGSFVLIITGMIDDIKPLGAKYKLIGQVIASLIVVFYGKILLQDVSVFGLYLDFGVFAYPFTIFFLLGCINCMNLIDGLDGLAAGISSIFFLTIGIIAYFQGAGGLAFELSFILTFIMLGSTTGFLVHNFYPAKIFMGDSGSMFLGFIISVITLLGFKSVLMSSIIIPMFILVVPILDTLLAIIRRKLKGESIDTPDKSHIHHQLLRKNLGIRNSVLIIYFITAIFSIDYIIYVLVDNMIGYIVYGILMIFIIVFILKTDILFDRNKKKKEGI
ncbi:MAG: undecaprenyl/decaprenyl-phosphate alpha-N-acetylglucosaminyl 1-phosphate transferase [Bacilli bacterium]|nr:undecaprenyl/decaprenyl-phosphate alpha-N-acetylglucosaminyl 1-phosphate transferase [Bacilli bacterium]